MLKTYFKDQYKSILMTKMSILEKEKKSKTGLEKHTFSNVLTTSQNKKGFFNKLHIIIHTYTHKTYLNKHKHI